MIAHLNNYILRN